MKNLLEKNKNSNQKVVFKKSWLRSLSFKLYAGLILFVLFILAISIFSWRSLLEMVNIQNTLIGENIPELTLSTGVAQQSERLMQMAPQLISSSSEKELIQIKKEINKDNQSLKKLIQNFEKSNFSKSSSEMKDQVEKMIGNLTALEKTVSQKRQWIHQMQIISHQMTDLNRKIHKTLVIEIDNKTFDLALQSKAISVENDLKPRQKIEINDILLYRQLLNLQSQTNISFSLLRETVNLLNADLIQPIQERFLASISACEKALKILPDHYSALKQNIHLLKQAGLGSQGIFAIKKKILDIEKIQNKYLKQNKIIAGGLAETVKQIKQDIQQDSSKTAQFFEQSLKKNRTLFFIINGISLIGSLVLAFFFIGPLIRRFTYLSNKMRQMSKGRLNEAVQMQGSDEVKDMAEALEVFRKHALEVQRLNLVEKLAEEVQQKNQTLENTIKDLNTTRNQLVIQEKLASLGQLTSGIAHEIKNPLNFINNFSKLSKELIDDLKEELKKISSSPSVSENSSNKPPTKKETWDFIEELLTDIQSNMEKISSHGERANDIIMGMLEHSRGKSGSQELVDVNKAMDTYSNLAFHSQRSLDSSFNVAFEKDYDKSLQPILAVPQDISRIILNLITNACDAVKEKHNHQNNVIQLKTQKEGNQIKMIIRDNGSGMPDSIKEKIFNPFFTTKATGQGTGLGLSLVHDIVTKHGGAVQVKSKEGEFTEFTVSLSIQPIQQKSEASS